MKRTKAFLPAMDADLVRRLAGAAGCYPAPALTANWLAAFGLVLALMSAPSNLHPQPASAPNRVLDLDGTGDYVQLPGFVFTNLSQATIEAWMKWRGFADASRVFDFGERQREMYIGTGVSGGSTLNGASLKFLIVDAA